MPNIALFLAGEMLDLDVEGILYFAYEKSCSTLATFPYYSAVSHARAKAEPHHTSMLAPTPAPCRVWVPSSPLADPERGSAAFSSRQRGGVRSPLSTSVDITAIAGGF
ncbi:MAG: hypothetical protein JXB30_03105 [Anaerolineae bacterium]|nr:hypothetical protein [Anaerolineae bacterium]